jgi:MSHA pilin protein MshC
MKRNGFTLIELVMVIVLIGIIAMYAAPRLSNISSTKAGSFREKLRADLRYAQNLAMTRNVRSRIGFSATSYSIRTSTTSTCSAFTLTTDPATSQPFTVDLTLAPYTGAGITMTLPAMTCLEYNSIGQPYDCTGLGNVCAVASSGMIITVNSSSGVAGSITVSSQTGAVN